MNDKNRIGRGYLRLKIALPVFFTSFLLITGLAIFSINYYFSMKSLEQAAFDYLAQTGTTVVQRTVGHLKSAAKIAQYSASILDPEQFRDDFYRLFNLITIPQFSKYPQFALVYFGSEEGNFWMNGRDPDGSISIQTVKRRIDGGDSDTYLKDIKKRQGQLSTEEVASSIRKYLETKVVYRSPDGRVLREEIVPDYIYDPRWRSWYVKARETGKTNWTKAYRFSSSGRYYASGKAGVTVSSPVITARNKLAGVIGVDIFLEELTNFLGTLRISNNGRAFITTPEGKMIAYGGGDPSVGSDIGIFAAISEITDKPAGMAFSQYRKITSGPERKAGVAEQFRFDTPQGQFLAYISPIPEKDGPPWLIYVIAPEDDFIGNLKTKLTFALMAAFGFLVFMVLFSIIIGRRITRPITLLMKDALLVKELKLKDSPRNISGFKEIADMNAAFQNMKVGLRSFKKYIPGDVVGQLIKSGDEAVLGGVSKNLTIFFSDVADFTSISEQLPPVELVGHLGEYLGEYSRIIQQYEGTVDKYIGDAVMAFWNAPGNLPEHAAKACAAALECLKRLKQLQISWYQNNLPILKTRIGLHTGEVIVGNMGSSERLNYTIIGDSVNLASRLEGLAKTYQVPVVVSETTKTLTDDEFAFRKLDRVVVKGKTVPVTIYELINARRNLSRQREKWIEYFENGLESYFRQKWREADRFFTQAYKMNPRDRAVHLYLRRIKFFRNSPPPTDWDGVARFKKKS